MPSSACDWSSDVCSSDRSEEHTSELQSRSDLVCRILRSEQHTSELQSRSDLVCRLLLEKKKSCSGGSRRATSYIIFARIESRTCRTVAHTHDSRHLWAV